jgi:hypothetical protein
MSKRYRHAEVTMLELQALATLAAVEEACFFERNPHLAAPYRNRLLAIALCQGAALQYLGKGYGVADFDVHFFYDQNPKKPKLSRTVKRNTADVGAFRGIDVDFVRTVVSGGDPSSPALVRIRGFLDAAPTPNALHLAQKAVVGLFPEDLFGVTIWPVG